MSESDDSSPRPGPTGVDQPLSTQFDWVDTPPSIAVVEAISVAANREPLDGPPLYDAVDSEALDDLFETEGRPPANLEVSFTYDGFDVTVTGAGTVTVRPAEGP